MPSPPARCWGSGLGRRELSTSAAEAAKPAAVPKNNADDGMSSNNAAASIGDNTDSRSYANRDNDNAEV